MQIFVSIVSYRDPLLWTTVVEAYNNAKYRDSLVFGIVDQGWPKETIDIDAIPFKNQIRYLRFDPQYARGVCWARNVAQSLWAGERYYFHCDSHTLFDSDWDEKFILQLEMLREWHERPAITAYPSAFLAVDNDIRNLQRTKLSGCLTLIADENHGFKGDSDMYVGTKCHIIEAHEPVHGYMASGNCLFTVGQFCQEVPYDPYLYFSGEEHSLALRMWTHGYNIFHVNDIPVYHHYGRDYRQTAWGDQTVEDARPVKWWEHDVRSKQRLREIVQGRDVGIYGLGTKRTLQQYIDYTGIDYHNRMLHDKAKWGLGVFEQDWRKQPRVQQQQILM